MNDIVETSREVGENIKDAEVIANGDVVINAMALNMTMVRHVQTGIRHVEFEKGHVYDRMEKLALKYFNNPKVLFERTRIDITVFSSSVGYLEEYPDYYDKRFPAHAKVEINGRYQGLLDISRATPPSCIEEVREFIAPIAGMHPCINDNVKRHIVAFANHVVGENDGSVITNWKKLRIMYSVVHETKLAGGQMCVEKNNVEDQRENTSRNRLLTEMKT